MPPLLRLSDGQYKHLASFLALPREQLDAVVADLKALPDTSLALRDLHAVLRKRFPVEDADSLARLLITIATFRRHHAISNGTAIKSVTRGIVKFAQWDDDQVEDWNKRSIPFLKACLDVEALHIMAKTADMAYDYDMILDRATIFTDLRPVFDTDHRVLIAGIISSLLRLEFRGASDLSAVTIAVDKNDIEKIMTECQTALQKIEILQSALASGQKVPTIENGEEIYDIS